MSKLVSLALLSVTVAAAHLLAAELPPPSSIDGILLSPGASNPNLSGWSSSSLWNYRIGTDNSMVEPTASGIDSLGCQWTDQAPDKSSLNINGGMIRAVFLGASTSWLNAIGYTLSGSPSGDSSFALASSTSPSTAVAPNSLNFGDCALFPLAAGEAGNFDLWFSDNAGLHELFSSVAAADSAGSLTVSWIQAPLMVPTLPGFSSDGTPIDTPTWIVNISEGTDSFRFALQGSSFAAAAFEPVPEPATYGAFAAVGLSGLIFWRRRRRTIQG